MLQQLRNQASSWVIKILLGLLILSFAVWGINDIFLGERDPVVVSVGDAGIPRSRVNDEIREEMNRLQPLFGGRLDRAEADRMGITGQVIENIINRTAVYQGASDLGVVIPDSLVVRRIRSDETFFNSRGEFDRAIFAQVLSRSGIGEGEYVASLKRDLAAAEISRAIGAAVPVPAAMVDPLVGFRSEQRIARAVTVPHVADAQVPEPTDAELQAYYEANKQRFMSPELRDVTWVHLDPEVVAHEISISEDRLKEAYEERREEFAVQDRRQLEQVVFASEDAAKTAAQALRDGKSLAEAARAAGTDKSPVSLGWVARHDMLPELAGPVFDLKKGEISAPVRTALGWHIVQVNDVQQGRMRPFSEVRDQLRQDVAQREASEAVFALANKLEDALAAGTTLEEAARQINLRAGRASGIDRRGRNVSGEPAENLPKTEVLTRLAFETDEGMDSPLTEAENGGFLILRVNKVTPPAQRPLEDVRPQAVAAWKAEAKGKATEKQAQAVAAKIRAGQSIDAAAGEAKLTVKTSPPFTRLTHDAESGLPAALMNELFGLRTGEVAMAEGPDGYTVAVLTEVRPAAEKERAETGQGLRDEIRQALSGDIFQQFVGAMRAQYDVEVHTDLLNAEQQ